jgi:hypothetical protein
MINLPESYFDLPEGYQPVFVYFSGEGGQEYFTASSKEAAVELVLKEKGATQYNSSFITHVLVKAAGNYFFRNGIPMYIGDSSKVNFK